MTTVIIAEDYIEISGHAPEKVVCHGISAVSQMTANYLEKEEFARTERSDGYLKIYKIKRIARSLSLVEAFVEALHDIDNEYPENIIFREV